MKFAMRWKLLPALVVILLAFSSHPVKADIQTSASAIVPSQVFDSLDNTVTVTISGAGNSTLSYLRPVFYRNGTSNYFGCVKTQCGTYYCGADPTMYPSIMGNGSVTMTIRSDTSSPFFTGGGAYQFKARRCTTTTCSTQYDSTPQTVEISQSSSSPAPINKDDSCPFPSPTASATTTASPDPSPTPTATPTNTPQPSNITLSEVYACPGTGANEWVEIANNNDTTVTLNNWELHDSTKTNKEVFTATIEAHGLLVYNLQNAMYNNDGDTVKLLKPDGTQSGNSFSYNACDPNTTWAIDSSGVWHPAIPTPGKPNQFPASSSTSSSTSATATPTPSSSPAAPSTTPFQATTTATESGRVLGAIDQTDPTATPSDPAQNQLQNVNRQITQSNSSKSMEYAAFGLIGIGLLSFTTLGGYLGWEWYRKRGLGAKH